MCIYFYVLIIMFVFVLLSFRAKPKQRDRYFMFCCCLMVLVLGLRGYQVGNDTPGYAQFISGKNYTGFFSYGTVDKPEESLEWGFVALMRIIHIFTSSPTVLFLLQQTFLFTIIYYLYKRTNQEYALWSLLLFFVLNHGQFVFLSVALRQAISTSFLLLGVCIIEYKKEEIKSFKGRWFRNKYLMLSIIIMLLAAFMHRTSIILFPFVLLSYYLKTSKKVAISIIAATSLIAMYIPDTFSQLFDFVLANIAGVADEKVSLMGDRYKDAFDDSSSQKVIFLFSRAVIPIFVIYFMDKKKVAPVFLNCILISTVISLIMSGSNMVARLVQVFAVIGGAAYVPMVAKRNLFVKCAMLVVTVGYLYKCYTAFVNWDYVEDSFLPYKFFWE